MTPQGTSARRLGQGTSARRLALSAGVLFFVNGAAYGNWIPRLPEIKDHLNVTNSGLGVALLGGGLGGLIGSLAVGAIMSRIGSRRLVLITVYVLALLMPLVAFVSQAWMFLVVLSFIGLFDVCADVAINAQGVIAQEQIGRSIMNRLHGMWSLGFASGTVVGSLGAGLEVDLRLQVLLVAAALMTAVGIVGRWLAKTDPSHHDDSASVPSSRHLGVIAIALAVVGAAAIALEGMPNEWGALLMRDEFGIGSWAGFGTVAFGLGMLLGRFTGDFVGSNRLRQDVSTCNCPHSGGIRGGDCHFAAVARVVGPVRFGRRTSGHLSAFVFVCCSCSWFECRGRSRCIDGGPANWRYGYHRVRGCTGRYLRPSRRVDRRGGGVARIVARIQRRHLATRVVPFFRANSQVCDHL